MLVHSGQLNVIVQLSVVGEGLLEQSVARLVLVSNARNYLVSHSRFRLSSGYFNFPVTG